ncbi:MAG: low specificity L-threonine aldolase [SAR324 cluster bacterium]|nr:low specificity L-threonine aldolase [SAR324 cluster bacterium]
MTEKIQQFASDNYSGICPEAFEFVVQANQRHEQAYGDDQWTQMACDRLRNVFEIDCEVFFVFNGTAANSLALASLCQSYQSIICHELAHVETDECGAPEFFSNGSKILTGSGINGKLTPENIEKLVWKRSDVHYPKPKVVSLTQSTEAGTVYNREELLNIRNVADKHGLKLHMDGARFANALARLNLQPKEISWQCGIDILCLGGTKNGLAVGDAILIFNKSLAEDFEYRCKQAGQLASKMRFLSAPWLGLLQNDVWLKNAGNANKRADDLARYLKEIPQVKVIYPVEANAVFVEMPQPVIDAMHKLGWHFYNFIGETGVRLMCSWDTSAETVDAFIRNLKAVV